jgi:hypothetical protein
MRLGKDRVRELHGEGLECRVSTFFGPTLGIQAMSRQIASMVLASLAISACNTQDRETNVHKLTLPKTEAACIAAGGLWNAPAPEKIVSGCSLKTTDGGHRCATSVQCQSACVEHAEGNRCAATVDGCFSETGRGTVRQCVN